ncbi:unnamed protein product, partial [Menidia menidia]
FARGGFARACPLIPKPPRADPGGQQTEERVPRHAAGPGPGPGSMSENGTGSEGGVTHHNVPALVFGVLLIAAVIGGNALVCVSVYLEKALKTTTNYFIVSLAFADLLLAVLVLPLFVYAEFQGGVWTLNMTLCDGLMTMDVMLCTASIFNLCAISRQLGLLAGTWLLALGVAAPVLLGVQDVAGRRGGRCRLEDSSYVVYSSVCSFFIPCPLMLLLYAGVFSGLRRWEDARRARLRSSIEACRSGGGAKGGGRGGGGGGGGARPRQDSGTEVLQIEPDQTMVRQALCESCSIPPALMSTVTWLGYVNSALNPVIYTIFNTEFKKFFKKCFRSCC